VLDLDFELLTCKYDCLHSIYQRSWLLRIAIPLFARVPFPDADISSHIGRIRGLQHVCSKPPNLTWRYSALQPPTVSSVFWQCCTTAKRVPHQPPRNRSHSISQPCLLSASRRVQRPSLLLLSPKCKASLPRSKASRHSHGRWIAGMRMHRQPTNAPKRGRKGSSNQRSITIRTANPIQFKVVTYFPSPRYLRTIYYCCATAGLAKPYPRRGARMVESVLAKSEGVRRDSEDIGLW